MKTIIVGSRKSELALNQTNWVINQLKSLGLPYQFEIKTIVTKGDKILDVTLSKVGGKGLFVKEIEQALLDGEIDFAVHSMKDMPAEMPPGLTLGSVPKRVDPRDCLISKDHKTLDQLPDGAVIGTSSLRRAAQLKKLRPDLEIRSIRGNLNTRIRKLEEENLDAIMLAAAGLIRLGWEHIITQFLSEGVSIPAVGQGALGIQCREKDEEIISLLEKINDTVTAETTRAERAFLHQLQGGCQVPIGAYCIKLGEEYQLTGIVGTPDGEILLHEQMNGNHPEELGRSLAEKLLSLGASEILSKVRIESNEE
ncbi:hydroxymethylbilane synthase [Microaerobacter geothermalis]|uniref:hydroxymethylbilane synthase n=1 Tax=Microaerobacter geothermalis TaxID=674972 RepID=UPI001F025C43|nr:hydroxymethylbilane synthase [Microaerobacter geothermalis]MCF6092668.1 hydroxymethylbilane synthase [Microaerobacter geothermalis]